MIIVVTGTGTGVGKTHVAGAVTRIARARAGAAVAWKPVESGVRGATGDDEAVLAAASSAPTPTIRLPEPLSPHLAARRAGVRIDAAALHDQLRALAAAWPVVVVELAGGLCSPFDDDQDGLDWLAAIAGDLRRRRRMLLVAPDRLGVLHDVSAAVRAATAAGVQIDALALAPPAVADAATGTNAAALAERALTHALPLAVVPRGRPDELAGDPGLGALVAALLRA